MSSQGTPTGLKGGRSHVGMFTKPSPHLCGLFVLFLWFHSQVPFGERSANSHTICSSGTLTLRSPLPSNKEHHVNHMLAALVGHHALGATAHL